MNVSIDSLIKKDSLNLETAKRNALEAAIKNSNNPTNLSFKVRVPNSRDAYLNDLNNAAWNFYLMAGDDSYYLFKAIVWSRRTIEISPKPAFYDTYAHLLYSLKFYDEAESMQKKAIDAGRAEKTDTGPFEEAYAKMRKRSL
jgi:tetratricopeptide (TPR) repeat protein